MADSLLFPFSGQIIVDSNGEPIPGAKLPVKDAGTDDDHNVYEDAALTTSADNPVECNSNGLVPLRYLGPGSWKVTFTDSSDVTLSNYATWDAVPGALDTSSFLTGTVSPSRASESVTTATTMTSDERGKQINCDATGGDFTYTLEAASAGGDGTDIVVKNTGASGIVTVDDGGNDLLLMPGDSATFRADGADWHTGEAFNRTDGVATIAYGASITPSMIHPTGTTYEVDTVTGALTVNNITDGRPGTQGVFRFVQDATGGRVVSWGANYTGEVYVDTSADAVSHVGFFVTGATTAEIYSLSDPREPVLSAILRYAPSSGTAAQGSLTAATWNTVTLDTLTDIDGRSVSSLSSSVFALLAGTYRIEAWLKLNNAGNAQARIRNTDDNSTGGADNASSSNATAEGGAFYVLADRVIIAATKNHELQAYPETGFAASTVGIAASSGENENYVTIKISRYAD
ncbi:MAG: hypothetical protein GY952_06795 [Rhodobacteraceae bacterium]|nr:hypothetical protein [Paracoccaceae bacterium]